MKKFFKWIGIIFVVLIIIGYLSDEKNGNTNNVPTSENTVTTESVKIVDTEKKEPQQKIYKTTARELNAAYDENEVAVDEAIKGAIVQVTGIVQSIDKDFTDSIVIRLKTDNEFMPASMTMNDSEKQIALGLKKGQKVVIKCKRMTRIIGSPAGSKCTFN
ncbi:OB-fold putative lipoprotein [Yersinia ruckeri]|uniref:OB-fold putative lipoprotein n=1 Tax=Yersinia ruckeri TaxID=29486 RepID=UPI002237CD55|nr:OB-fold putative lipoprotein [Yersinia ruckeri]MCW6548609.1 OB-fold putative lipoprotein [Yersinia ruckeri]MCW6553692.1 OB-fold putative lipoprotein [Yersinia ruckeri]MCW6557052.1 OB-fold putative lipoprotein [Yersinia ruckeri]MCW6582037.1 OB-fold putative lipoprotein [Yersinia ruckeri]MCW6595820.1 OB-fold putative lipoprotein [Yersinia ruckeri]